MSRLQINRLADDISRRYTRLVGAERVHLGISFNDVYEELIYPDYGIVLVEDEDLGFNDQGDKILGKYLPMENTAFIDPCLKNDPRREFTCWHEAGGHGVLQGDCLRQQFAAKRRQEAIVTVDDGLSFDTINQLEAQANWFASHAAASVWYLDYAMMQEFDLTRPIRYCGPGPYTLIVRGASRYCEIDSFDHLCWKVAKHIRWRFGGLSVEALSYRLIEDGFVKDYTKVTREMPLYRTTPRQLACA